MRAGIRQKQPFINALSRLGAPGVQNTASNTFVFAPLRSLISQCLSFLLILIFPSSSCENQMNLCLLLVKVDIKTTSSLVAGTSLLFGSVYYSRLGPLHIVNTWEIVYWLSGCIVMEVKISNDRTTHSSFSLIWNTQCKNSRRIVCILALNLCLVGSS